MSRRKYLGNVKYSSEMKKMTTHHHESDLALDLTVRSHSVAPPERRVANSMAHTHASTAMSLASQNVIEAARLTYPRSLSRSTSGERRVCVVQRVPCTNLHATQPAQPTYFLLLSQFDTSLVALFPADPKGTPRYDRFSACA